MLYLKNVLLLLTILGYVVFLKKRLALRVEFGPAVVCAGFSVVLFFAGILNMLLPMVVLLTLGGLGLFVYEAVKTKGRLFDTGRELLVCGIWGAAIVYFAILLRGAHFVQYDNFSHWVVVIKSMLLDNRMPNFQDELVAFQAYPLGSALFIYYVCRAIGDSESCYIFGQMILLISFMLPLAAFVEKKNLLGGILVPLFAVVALVCNISIYDLLVDTLLPLAGLALFCIIEKETEKSEADGVGRTIGWIALLSIFLMQVKNSGIFFCLVAWIYFLVRSSALHLPKKKVLPLFLGGGILLPLFSAYLWKQHVKLVFAAGETSKHAMSVANYRHVLGEKTLSDITGVAIQMVKTISNIRNISMLFLLVITAMLLGPAVCAVVQKNTRRALALVKELCALYGIFVLYLVSVFGMYVFSMPLSEAAQLAGFGRYMLTIDIFLLGIAVSFALRNSEGQADAPALVLPVLCILPLVFACKRELPILVQRQNYQATRRYAYQQLLQEYQVPTGGSYLVYNTEDDAGYLYYVTCYELWSNDVRVVNADSLDDGLGVMGSYDYLIVATPDETSQGRLRDAGFAEYATGEAVVIATDAAANP